MCLFRSDSRPKNFAIKILYLNLLNTSICQLISLTLTLRIRGAIPPVHHTPSRRRAQLSSIICNEFGHNKLNCDYYFPSVKTNIKLNVEWDPFDCHSVVDRPVMNENKGKLGFPCTAEPPLIWERLRKTKNSLN
jgi:hypothetical protein